MKTPPFRLPAALIAGLLFGMLLCTTNSAYAVWQLTWSDEFNGSSVTTTNWTYDIGNGFYAGGTFISGWGNNELEYYTSRTQNVYVANGLLHIAAQQESYSNFNYTSGRIKTTGLFSQTYGRFEFRAKLPQGTGTWPALWMLPQNSPYGGWPNSGEVDIVENNGNTPTQEGGTIHYGGANGDVYSGKTYTFPSGDSVTNFHIYALEWTSNSISWSVDGTIYEVQTNWYSNIGTSTSTYPYPAPFDTPFYILMNLAIGGNYLGNPSTSTINSGTVFPAEMQVDYVRVYQDVPATTAPNSPTNLTVSPGSSTVFLSWDASTSGATGYNVKRSTVSGGPYTTIASTGVNSYTDTGLSSCSSYYYVVTATNSFGASTNSNQGAASLGSYYLAVNSGGSGAGPFIADAYFSGGTVGSSTLTPIDTSGVSAPAPQAVYQTERFGNCTYTFTGLSAGTSYKVRLHFAETYWSSVGQRVFNVFINGQNVLTNFDIIAVAGAANKATIREFTVTPSGGQIAVQYATVTDNAKSSGIELELQRTATPVAGNNGPLYAGATLDLTASTISGATYSWTGPNGFTSSLQNPTIVQASASASGAYTVTAIAGGCASAPATTLVTVNPRPTLSFQLLGTNLMLTWPSGTLQTATNLTGPWGNVTGASTPYTTSTSQPRQFYRLKLQ